MLYVWGNNSVGQLGNQETNTSYSSPLFNKLSIQIDSISCGEEHTLILTRNRQVYAMGSNNYGALGIGSDDYELVYPEPTFLKSISHLRVNKVAAGWNHNLAILECGSLYVWGRGDNGQLGIDDQVNLLEPENVEIQINGTWVGVRDASCGLRHTAIVTTNSVAMSTGNNDSGQLGLGHRQRQCQFQLVELEEKVVQVACGVSHTLFLSNNQRVYSSGSNNLFQLGIGKSARMAIEPQLINELKNIVQVAAGNHSGALSESGHLYLWGQGSFGSVERPLLFNQDRFEFIEIGGTTGGAINQNGQLYMWGSNSMGQLGVGDNENRIEPIKVNKLSGLQCISIGQGFVVGIGQQQKQNVFTLQNQSFDLKEVDEEQEQDSQEIEMKQQQNQNGLISMDLLVSEKEYLAKTLEIESQERMALEKINRELKAKIYELTEGDDGITSQNIRLREKEQQISLLNNRMKELNENYNEQNREMMEQRKEMHSLQQELQMKKEQNAMLVNKQNDIDYVMKQKNQELETSQMQVLKSEEHYKVYHIQQQENIKQMQLQINDLNIQLIHEREMKDKLACTYNQEKHNHQSLQANYASLQDKFNKLSSKSMVLTNQLENSLIQHSKLSDALQMSLHRIESLQSSNSKLMSDLSLLRTSLYANNVSSGSNIQPMEVQAIVKLNQELTSVNTQLQNKIKSKDMELIKLKNYINNNTSNNHSNVSHRYQEEPSNQSISHQSSHHPEANSPVGKTISELLESAHKHAKFMKRILKDIDQDEENQYARSEGKAQHSDVLKPKNIIL